jgi:hypothetical protein
MTDQLERYPEPIKNFQAWMGAVKAMAARATSDHEIDHAVRLVHEYASQKWCLPSRLDEIAEVAQMRRSELRRASGKDRAAGADA